jgi:hypothetical protein
MARTTLDIWNPQFLETAPLFETLRSVAQCYAGKPDWPALDDLTKQFVERNVPISLVPQGGKPGCLEEKYESRIYLQRELQTRSENWHDFFNAMIWLLFPKTKSALNALHYHASLQRPPKTNRGPLENAITCFDESGAVIISRREDLLQIIRDHAWQQLFVENRSAFGRDIHCLIFGHALYEKALQPYVGMTAQSMLIYSSEPLHNDLSKLDAQMAMQWRSSVITSPRDLTSFPILGVPGWHAKNEYPDFYQNKHYFRPKPDRS